MRDRCRLPRSRRIRRAAHGRSQLRKHEQRYNEKKLSPALQKTEETRPVLSPNRPKGLGRHAFLGTMSPHFVPPLRLQNTDRLANLIRQGKLYLSLHDAILLAVENNLDVEQQSYQLAMADTDVIRAKGGGVIRGLPLTVAAVAGRHWRTRQSAAE